MQPRHLEGIEWRPRREVDLGQWPYAVPAVRQLIDEGGLDIGPGVTILVGENGSGKSTLIEAFATVYPRRGAESSSPIPVTGPSGSMEDSPLHWHLKARTHGLAAPGGFFLRAESFYNVATEVDQLGTLDPYGGRSLHERSHGESFLALAVHRFGPRGLYLLDEPESALSVHGCLALLARMVDLVAEGSQFIVATHSPILLAYPVAAIWQIDADGTVRRVDYDDADPVRMHRDFLADPGRYLHHLLRDDDPPA